MITETPISPGPGGSSNSHTNVFQLAIRHAVLDSGEMYYNDRKIPLEADAHDVKFRSSFDPGLQEYSGRLSYVDGRFVAGSLRPIPHNLDAQFNATPTAFHLTTATLTSGPSRIAMTATLEHYGNPDITAQYQAVLDGNEFRELLNNPSVPSGIINTSGSLRYADTANRSIIDSLLLDGILTTRQLDVRNPKVSARIRDVSAHYSLANGDATVQDLRANLLGGELTGFGQMSQVGGNSRSALKISLQRISLSELKQALRTSSVPANIRITGLMNAQANAAWGNSFGDLVLHADATVQGRVANAHQANGGNVVLPVSSILHGAYAASTDQLTLTNSYIRMPATSLSMDGTVSRRSDLALLFHSSDLGELETIADVLWPVAVGRPAPALGLAGTASFHGTVRGSTVAPHVTGQLTASNLRVNGTSWQQLRTDVDASPSFVALRNGDLQPASGGRITYDASAGLYKWSFKQTSPIEVSLDASQLDVANLTRLARSQVHLTGSLSANVKVHGSELNPAGNGNVLLTHATIYDEPVRSARLNFSGTAGKIHGELVAHLPAGTVQSKLTVDPQQKSYVGQITAQQIRLDQIQILKSKNIDTHGVVDLHASGQGTFDNPQFAATVQIPHLEIQKQALTAVNLQVNVANHVATAALTSEAVHSSIRANARVNLSGEYDADATLDTQAIPLQPLLALYAPSQLPDFSGQTELHASLRGPLKNRRLLVAHIVIPTLQLAYGKNIQLAAVAPIHVDYDQGTLVLQHAQIRGTDTDLQFQASIPVNGNTPPSLVLLGTVNLQLAQLFNPDITSSGELKFNINSHGAIASGLAGQVEIVNANYANSDLPLGLQHGNGVLTLSQHRLNIQKFQAVVGGGTLTAQGGITYRPTVHFDLGLAAKDVRMLYPQGVRESVNANLRLNGSPEAAVLGGAVNISDISLTPAFELTDFITQFSSGVAAPPTPGFAQNLRLNVAVHAANDVNLVSRTLSVAGNANLQVRGTAAQPVILGRVNLNNGDIIFNGDRFVLNGGTIEFVNPSETQPVVNVTLNTTIQQYNISMRFNGPVDQLRTNYSSNPSLPSADIINLLAFGQTTEAGANSPTPANQAAESLVASQVSSQITSRFSKIAGISQLSINPVLAGGTTEGPPGANVTIQQRVTGNLFVTFSTNVASTQDQTIMGQYQLSPRVAISATRDENGGFAVDALINKSW